MEKNKYKNIRTKQKTVSRKKKKKELNRDSKSDIMHICVTLMTDVVIYNLEKLNYVIFVRHVIITLYKFTDYLHGPQSFHTQRPFVSFYIFKTLSKLFSISCISISVIIFVFLFLFITFCLYLISPKSRLGPIFFQHFLSFFFSFVEK